MTNTATTLDQHTILAEYMHRRLLDTVEELQRAREISTVRDVSTTHYRNPRFFGFGVLCTLCSTLPVWSSYQDREVQLYYAWEDGGHCFTVDPYDIADSKEERLAMTSFTHDDAPVWHAFMQRLMMYKEATFPDVSRPLRVYLLHGYSGAGKDTLYTFMRAHDPRLVRLACADTLKDMVAEEHKFERAWADDPIKKKQPLGGIFEERTIKDLCRDLWNRYLASAPETFIARVAEQLLCAHVHHASDTFVLTDFRYAFESEYLRRMFPHARLVHVHVVRPSLGTPDLSKQTEDANLRYFPFDRVVWNAGTLDDLSRETVELLREVQ